MQNVVGQSVAETECLGAETNQHGRDIFLVIDQLYFRQIAGHRGRVRNLSLALLPKPFHGRS